MQRIVMGFLGNTFGNFIYQENNNSRENSTTQEEHLFNQLKPIKFIKKEEEISCPVCLEEFKDKEDIIELPCQHLFHKKCIGEWLKQNHSCPTCRKKLDINSSQGESSSSDNIDIFGNWINTFINSITNEISQDRVNDVIGARVTLYGIISEPGLNGQSAVIIDHHRDERYIVRLNNGRSISISIRNMTINRGIINENIINNINLIINTSSRESSILQMISNIMSPPLQFTSNYSQSYYPQSSYSIFNSW